MSAAPTEIRSYRLDPQAFEGITKRRIYRRIAWVTAFVVLFVTIQLAVMSTLQEGVGDSLPFSIPIILAALGFGGFRAVRMQLKNGKAAWASYQLTMSPNVLRRVIVNLPPIEILRTEVTRIVDVEAEGLTVATADRHRFIFIPRQLIGFGEVCTQLLTWRAFEAPKLAQNRALAVSWTVLLIGSWIACGVIPNLGLAMLAGATLVAVGAFAIREILKVNVFDNKQKAASIGGLVFMMFAPFARLILHFVFHVETGWPQ